MVYPILMQTAGNDNAYSVMLDTERAASKEAC